MAAMNLLRFDSYEEAMVILFGLCSRDRTLCLGYPFLGFPRSDLSREIRRSMVC